MQFSQSVSQCSTATMTPVRVPTPINTTSTTTTTTTVNVKALLANKIIQKKHKTLLAQRTNEILASASNSFPETQILSRRRILSFIPPTAAILPTSAQFPLPAPSSVLSLSHSHESHNPQAFCESQATTNGNSAGLCVDIWGHVFNMVIYSFSDAVLNEFIQSFWNDQYEAVYQGYNLGDASCTCCTATGNAPRPNYNLTCCESLPHWQHQPSQQQ